MMHYPTVHPLLDPRTRSILEAELAQASNNPKLRSLLERAPELWPGLVRCYLHLAHLPRRMRRQLQRQWRCRLGALAVLLALGQAPALAATIPVDGTTCTLVDAITTANSDTNTGGCVLSDNLGGADTLVLPANSTQTLTAVNNTTLGATGLPVISSAITIQGNGSTITRSSAANFRIIAVNSTGNLTVQSTTISGGNTNSPNAGGGIANSSGTVTLTDSTVTGNTAYAAGGGVSNDGTMTITHSTVSGNSSGEDAGGVGNFGTMTITHSTVSGNSSGEDAGGVGNAGTMTMTNSTVSGNFAYDDRGGVSNDGTMTITHSTVSGNYVGDNFGGVLNFGTMTLSRTLISGNTGGFSEVTNFSGGTLNANDYNLFGSNGSSGTSFTPGATDIVPASGVTVADILASLADNGGPTQTHALVAGSPAIDAVLGTCPPPLTDQRGETRPQGTHCDIGSFEVMVAPSPDLAVSKTDSPDPVVVTDHLTYTLTVNNAGEGDATGVTLTDTLPSSVDFVSVSPSGSCGESAGTVECDLGALASGANATVTIVVQPTATEIITNSVAVTSVETDDNLGNNSDSEDTTVNALLCNGLVPTIVGTPGNDPNLRGTNGRDVIHGLGGNDTISGLNDNDVICGGEGTDTLNGGNGNDRLFGENGTDTLNGNNGADALDGGTGTDTCNGGSGSDSGTACESVTSIP